MHRRANRWRLALLAGAVLLTSCGSFTRPGCHSADWGALGYEYGARGFAATGASKQTTRCTSGAQADLTAWREGYDEGLKVYCEPSNAAQMGAESVVPADICNDTRSEPFLAAYRLGKDLRYKQMELAEALRERDEAARTMAELQTAFSKYAAVADNTSQTISRRSAALSAQHHAGEDQPDARERLLHWETEVVRLEIELETARRELDERYPGWRR